MSDTTIAPTSTPTGMRKPAAVFVFITVLIDMMGIGLVIPVLPSLVESFTGGGPSVASHSFGLMQASYATALFLFAPMLGALSDRFGRRPILLLSLTGIGIDYVLTALAPTLTLLFIARIVAGACGASYTTANAYVADVTPPEKRAQAFGLIGAAFGVGFVLGPALGGLLGGFGPRVPFWVAAGLAFANVLYGLFVLPESLPRTERRRFRIGAANPFGALSRLRRYGAATGLAAVWFVVQFGGTVPQSIWVLFTQYRFDWHAGEVGLSLAVVGIFFGAVQGFVTGLVVPRIGERRAALIGLALFVLGSILYAIADQGWHMYAVTAIYCLGGFAGPAIQSLLSRTVPANEQGELQGTLTSIASVAAIVAPLIATALFGGFTGPSAPFELPGAPFLLEAILMAVAMLLVAIVVPKRRAA